jgi:hypothetical protein
MYKPVDMFSDYSDVMNKNSAILRRGQFNAPLGKEEFSIFKRTAKSKSSAGGSMRYDTIQSHNKSSLNYKTQSNFRLGNTISESFQKSIQ